MRSLVLLPALLFAFFGSSLSAFADCQPSSDVLESLKCLDNVDVKEVNTTQAGYRQFELKFTQPTDHFASASGGGETFQQRVVLLHKAWNEPMVMQTSGYSIFGTSLSRLAATYGTNQIQVEHRFFEKSTPVSNDWSKLDIAQSAADFHAITVALRSLYQTRWVGTGASKGGMTSTFHRAFYPDDLDGTVADVAPMSFATDDGRYVDFVDKVGGAEYAECRTKLYDLQKALLERRSEILSRISGDFNQLGSASVGFEHAVIEMPFVFWQYGNPKSTTAGCSAVPSSTATTAKMFEFLDTANEVKGYSDETFNSFQSYYFQSGTQLGGPGAKLDHIQSLKKHEYSISQYMPKGVNYSYSAGEMQRISKWVAGEARNIMFVYGEYDPWTGGEYDIGNVEQAAARNVYKFMVPGGNHSAKFNMLPTEEKKRAMAILTKWFGKAPLLNLAPVDPGLGDSLDDIELEALRARGRRL